MRKQLVESPEIDTTIRSIVSDLNSIPMLYNALRDLMQNYYDSHGKLDQGFGIVSGGPKSRWMDTVYNKSLRHQLNHLCKLAPKNTANLKQFMNRLSSKFGSIEEEVPYLLEELGSALHSQDLLRSTKRWISEIDKFVELKAKLVALGKAENNAPQAKPEKTKDTATGQQNSQVEHIIADVLSRLPSKVAAEIRTAIARKDNKLQALQAEIQSRNLTVTESIKRKFKQLMEAELDSAIHEMTAIMESKFRNVETRAVPGMKSHSKLNNNNSTYDAYRYGIALASAPDEKVDSKGPNGGDFTTVSYSEADDTIVKAASKNIKSSAKTHGSKKSAECRDTNTVSPVANIKRNKYGV
jgi:hypothetical protein